MRLIICTLLVLMYTQAITQSSFEDKITELNYLGDIQVTADSPEHRVRAMYAYNKILSALHSAGDLKRTQLAQLKYVSKITPADSSFTLVSWRVFGVDTVHYYGFVYTDDLVIKLHEDTVIKLSSTETYTDDRWWGSLYYNITSVNTQGGKAHIIYGHHQDIEGRQTKVAESIRIKNNQVIFGTPLFEDKQSEELINRIILHYGKNSNVTLNYNSGISMIMLDHLVRGRSTDGRPSMLPDGSYVGYQWDGKKWKYIDKIYNQVSETTPRPMPILGKSEGVNIFGRHRK